MASANLRVPEEFNEIIKYVTSSEEIQSSFFNNE